ncbi:CHRD domain-containing protein [Paraherbaspirillum soli]|uniref:CHRD domain-containing protein n=1 Tax=Paraherbaspirillum soli TaxID=631222 RepID=A0ABW0MER6_9BURK
MITLQKHARSLLFVTLTMLLGIGSAMAENPTSHVTLTGAQEVPPVSTKASGTGKIVVDTEKMVSGSVTVEGFDSMASHIHKGAAGKAGPVIHPLTKTAPNTWSVPAGTKLTDDEYVDYMAGNLYVNVHSVAHPGGEVRGQLTPK